MAIETINELIRQHNILTKNIDHLERLYPGLSHLNTKAGKPLKKKWEHLVHLRYCVDQILTGLYDYQDFNYKELEIVE